MSINWPTSNLDDESQQWRRKVEETLDEAVRNGALAKVNGKAQEKANKATRSALNRANLDLRDQQDQLDQARRIPAAPSDPDITTDAYFDEYGYPKARVFATSDEVTTDVQGEPIGIVRYELAGRKNVAGESWEVVAEQVAVYEEAPQLEAMGLPAGEEWAFKIRAVSDSNIAGEYSGQTIVTLAKDETAPPKPATPTATSRLGQIIIEWSGLDATGGAQPADFSHAEVGMASTAAGAGTIVGQIGRNGDTFVAPEVPYEDQRWFYVVAVDFAGNRSVESDRASAVNRPLVDTDIIGRVIDGANIKIDSIQEDVIAAGAISEEKISNEVNEKIQDAVTDAANALLTVATIGDGALQYIANPNFRTDQSAIEGFGRWVNSSPGGRLVGPETIGVYALAFGVTSDAVYMAEGGQWGTWFSSPDGGTGQPIPAGATVQIQASGLFTGGSESLITVEIINGATSLASEVFPPAVSNNSALTLNYTNVLPTSFTPRVRITCAGTDGMSQIAAIRKLTAVDITAAQFALDTANGKNKNYYQPGPPTGGTYGEGDTWFDTDDGNAIYRWDVTTSAWVPVLLSGEALAEQVTDAIDEAQANAQNAVNDAANALTVAGGNVKSIITQYAQNTSPTTAPTTGWSTTAPPHTSGSYTWMRQVTTLGNDTTVTSSPVMVTGNDGADGAGIEIAGTVATYSALPTGLGPGDAGKAYLVSADGKLYIWDGSAWPANGAGVVFQGPPGSPGSPGTPGADGTGVTSITPYYLLKGAGTGAPAKPTTNPPTGGWTTTEPGYQSSMELYRTELILLSDNSFGYSNVSKVSAYTGSTQALTVANLAQASADGKVKASQTDPGHDVGRIWLVLNGNGDCIGIRISNGSAWSSYTLMADQILVPSSVGTTSIANGAITTPKIVAGAITAESGIIANAAIGTANIADAAITNAKIANIDAGKVTTGFLDAGRIDAKSITADKLLIGSTENLLVDPRMEQPLSTVWYSRTGTPLVASNYEITSSSVVGGAMLRCYASGAVKVLSSKNRVTVQPREVYAVGARVRYNSWAGAPVALRISFYTAAGAASGSQEVNIPTSAPGGSTFSAQVTIPDSASVVAAEFEVIIYATSTSGSFDMGQPYWRLASTGELIVDGAITADKIAANAVTAAKIEAGAITAGKIAANSIGANEIIANSITAGELAANSVTASELAANSVSAGSIQANAVTADKIEAGAIATVKLDAEAVTSAKIQANAITADKLQADAITAKHTITGALVRTAASGARTEMNTSGLRVLNSANQELVKLGYGIGTGMEVRNPFTGAMVPLANAAFGMASAANTDTLAYAPTGSPMGIFHAFTRHTADTCILNFTAVSNKYLIRFGQTWTVSADTSNGGLNVHIQPVVNGTPVVVSGHPFNAQAPNLFTGWSEAARRIGLGEGTLTLDTTPGASYEVLMRFAVFATRPTTGVINSALRNRYISATPVFQ